MSIEMVTTISDELIDRHLDNVLRAGGSALKYYSLAKSLDDMRDAMRRAMEESAIAEAKGVKLLQEVKRKLTPPELQQ